MILNYACIACLVLVIFVIIYAGSINDDFTDFENKQKNINLKNYEVVRELYREIKLLKEDVKELRRIETAKETNKESERDNS